MAESLGVSQIYMGFVLTAARMGRKNAFARIAGITGRPQAIMALGIPAFRYSKSDPVFFSISHFYIIFVVLRSKINKTDSSVWIL